jgi:hypothetical protein
LKQDKREFGGYLTYYIYVPFCPPAWSIKVLGEFEEAKEPYERVLDLVGRKQAFGMTA